MLVDLVHFAGRLFGRLLSRLLGASVDCIPVAFGLSVSRIFDTVTPLLKFVASSTT